MALLDLKTESHRETVIIDGEEYALAAFDGFSITDQHKLQQDGKRLSAIGERISAEGKHEDADLTDAEAADLEKTSDALFLRIAGDIPDLVRAKLKPMARQEITNAYFLASAKRLESRSKATSRNGRKTGFRRSQGSTRQSRSKTG